MNEEPKIKSINSFRKNLIIFLVGGIGFLFLSYYLISISLNTPYPQIVGIIFGGIIGLIGLWSLKTIYHFDSIFIFDDHFKVKSFWGNTKKIIFFNEITGWAEIKKNNKYSTWSELTIYTKKTKYIINSSIYKNYYEIRKVLVKGKTKDVQKEKNWQRRNNLLYAIALIALGGIFIANSLHSFLTKSKEIQYNELHTITDIISNKAEITKGSKGSRYIIIKLKSYPYFNFEITGYGYSAADKSSYVSNVQIGDTLHVGIMKDAYLKKLSKEKTPGFWDKSVNYPLIRILELNDNNHTYLKLSEYNKQYNKHKPFVIWVSAIIGLSAFVFSLPYLFKR